jgi:hypothetical protein
MAFLHITKRAKPCASWDNSFVFFFLDSLNILVIVIFTIATHKQIITIVMSELLL